jgi:plastocyanin
MRMRLVWALLLVFSIAAPAARAGELVVALKDASGEPVANAVVTYHPAAGAPTPHPAGPYVMAQADIRFEPFVMVVPAGAAVHFPNHDKVRHHVYSFSSAKRFELKLYGRDETRSVTFDHPGVVSLGCNIHDQMIGFIFVSDTPYVAKSDPRGEVALDLPPGPGTLTVWQPFLKSPRNEMIRTFTVPALGGARLDLALELRQPPAGKAL